MSEQDSEFKPWADDGFTWEEIVAGLPIRSDDECRTIHEGVDKLFKKHGETTPDTRSLMDGVIHCSEAVLENMHWPDGVTLQQKEYLALHTEWVVRTKNRETEAKRKGKGGGGE